MFNVQFTAKSVYEFQMELSWFSIDLVSQSRQLLPPPAEEIEPHQLSEIGRVIKVSVKMDERKAETKYAVPMYSAILRRRKLRGINHQ